MFVSQEIFEAEIEMRAEEARKARLAQEALRARRAERGSRAWRWRVETGMEGSFRSLLAWLLSSQRGELAEAEQASSEPAGTRPAAVPVKGERSEWTARPLPYVGWDCYA